MSKEFQVYLSARVQKHFGISPKNLQADSEIEPAAEWYRCWRIEYVIDNPNSGQHLMLVTNSASLFSFLIPIGFDATFEELISLFFKFWFDQLVTRNFDVPMPINSECKFLRGRPSKLIGSMNQLVYFTTLSVCEDNESIEIAHKKIRHIPMKKGKDYIFPDQEFERLLLEDPPYPRGSGSNIIQFPGLN